MPARAAQRNQRRDPATATANPDSTGRAAGPWRPGGVVVAAISHRRPRSTLHRTRRYAGRLPQDQRTADDQVMSDVDSSIVCRSASKRR